MQINIYIDAYHTGYTKKGTGSYSLVLEYIKDGVPVTREYIEGMKGTTKYRTEITACIEALKHVVKLCDINLVINSVHVIQSINTGAWIQRLETGINAKKQPAKNLDLWQQLYDLAGKYDVTFTYAEKNQYTDYMKYKMEHTQIEYKEDLNNV